jgi:hypothetical protein
MAILADTGFLIALLDADDSHHRQAADLLKRGREAVVVPAVVLPEVCYLAQKYLGAQAEVAFLKGLLQGDFALEWGEPADLKRAVEILGARPEFGMVDATVMAVAERLHIRRVATFDRRHFGSFQPAHSGPFELRP